MEQPRRNHYEVLGVSRDASGEEIRRAFRALALRHHPDVSAGTDAGDRFQEISDAYGVLNDPVSRARYDKSALRGSWAPRGSHVARSSSGRRRADDVPRFLDEEPRSWTVVIEIRNWGLDIH